MYIFYRMVAVLCLLHLFVLPGLASQEREAYDAQFTSLALNYAIMSIYKVKEMPSRATVESEYRSITNNLAFANIENDYKLVELIKNMMDTYTEERLDEREQQIIRRAYERRVNIAFSSVRKKSDIYMEAGVNTALPVLTSIISGEWKEAGKELLGGARNMFTALQENDKAILQATNQEMEYMDERERNEWTIEKEKLRRFNGLQKSLMDANWDLMRRYRLPESSRLTEDDIKAYYSFTASKDPKTALRLAERLQDRLGNYPPFWLVYGHKARMVGNDKLARICFENYEKVWRPVLRRDITMSAMAREKIFVLHSNEKDECKRLLVLIEKHKAEDDWNTTLFLGLQSFIIGDKAKAQKLIQANIDDGYNVDLNRTILAQVERGRLDLASIEGVALREFRDPSELEKLAATGNVDAQYRLGELLYWRVTDGKYIEARPWFEKAAAQGHLLAKAYYADILSHNGQLPEAQKIFASIRTPLERQAKANDEQAQLLVGMLEKCVMKNHTVSLHWVRPLAEKGNAWAQNELGLAYFFGGIVPEDKHEAVKWFRKAAEQGDSNAQTTLGSCYEQGIGVAEDKREAANWYHKGRRSQGVFLSH